MTYPLKSCPTCGKVLFTAFQKKPPAAPYYLVFCSMCAAVDSFGKGNTENEAVIDFHRRRQPQ